MCVLFSETTHRALGRTRNLHYWQIIGFQPQGLCTCFLTYTIIRTSQLLSSQPVSDDGCPVSHSPQQEIDGKLQ